MTRRLGLCPARRSGSPRACVRYSRPGPATLVLYDVTTLYFEPMRVTGSESRVLQGATPRTADHRGIVDRFGRVPLMVGAFEGNRSAVTMIRTLRRFMAAHNLADVVIVADAGMISEANMAAIEAENRRSSWP